MNKSEKKALFGFLIIYTLSSFILMSIIAFLYYNKEIVTIQNQCSIQMRSASLNIEKDLMSAEMDKIPYKFSPPNNKLKIGLFDQNGKIIYSNLKDNSVLLSQKAYKNNLHKYHINKLTKPILGVLYIVVEDNSTYGQKLKLITLLVSAILIVSIFILFIGFLLSKVLIKPIKSRIEKLNRFILDSSHELNTPVSALMMSVSSLKKSNKKDPRIINHISVSTKLISQIFNTLSFVSFKDIDEIYNENFDLKELIEESIRFFNEIANSKNMSIKCDIETTFVFLDKFRIQRIINNLLSNAIKYGFRNSIIEVILKEYTFCIVNEGRGISKKDQETIFERFERRDNSESGFGLGLDIVKSICKEYNIKIKVESTPCKKTVFFLTFPRPDKNRRQS